MVDKEVEEGRLYYDGKNRKWVRFEQRGGVWHRLGCVAPKVIDNRYNPLILEDVSCGTILSEVDKGNLGKIDGGIGNLLKKYVRTEGIMQQTKARRRDYVLWGRWIGKVLGKIR